MRRNGKRTEDGGAIIVYLVAALVVMATLAAISSFVVNNLRTAGHRQDMIGALKIAEGGVALACRDVETAFTNGGVFTDNLVSGPNAYVKDNTQSSASEVVYTRAITSPFTNQTVSLELRMTNSTAPSRVKAAATATLGNATQRVEAHMETTFGMGAMILSTATASTGAPSSGVSKSAAQRGNVVVVGGNHGVTWVDGGIIANLSVNTNHCYVDEVSAMLAGTAREVPDYTNPGAEHQLFDFGRFTAVAKESGNYYASLADFLAVAATGTVFEGVVVVEVQEGENKISDSDVPSGINVRGTLVFKFTSDWSPSDKLVNTATVNINPANLAGLVPDDPTTFTTGYPPVYSDPLKNPANVDIRGYGYDNFAPDDDLPAFMYNNAIFDIHGPANICGVVYSPVFMEIENKQNGQIQYFKGMMIGGGGVLLENKNDGATIASYDQAALDRLATYAGRGKSVEVVYHR